MSGIEVSRFFLTAGSTIEDAITAIDRSGRVSLALMVDDQQRLVNTVSDGDIRRGLLAGLRLTDPAEKLFAIKAQTPYPAPISAPIGTDSGTLLGLMQTRSVRQVPLLDRTGRVVDIALLRDLLPSAVDTFCGVVIAGGMGKPLPPPTEDRPKATV